MSTQQKHIVSHPPFLRVGNTLFSRNCTIMVAALFALVPGMLMYGTAALGVVCLSVSTSVFWEFAVSRLSGKDVAAGDGSSVVTGLVFAMMMPATMPWWAVFTGTFVAIVMGKMIFGGTVFTGTFVAIVMGKMIFGGTGCNPFNPAVVAVAVMLVSWPHLLDFSAALVNCDFGFNMVEPLWSVKFFGASMADNYLIPDLLLGKHAGGIGSVTGAGILAGGLILVISGISRWEISLSFLAGVFISAWGFHLSNPDLYASPLFHLLTGYTLIGAFFLATEDSSSPVNPIPMFLYGLGGGCLTVLIRNKGMYVDGVLFAVLLMNLASPILDKIRPAVIGQGV